MTKNGSSFYAAGTRILLVAVTLCLGLGPTRSTIAAEPKSRIIGLWLDHTGRGAVDIKQCGKALCGEIIWLAQPFSKTGKPLTDIYNEAPSKRKRTICGLKIIGNTKKLATNLYDNGWIYGPEKGKTFDVELRLIKADQLQVTGYASLKIFSEVYLWKRLPETHPIRAQGKTCHNAAVE